MSDEPDFISESSSSPDSEPDVLVGVFEHITFANPENGFTVGRLLPEGSRAPVTIVGNLFGSNVGETLKVVGRWEDKRQFGRQFKVESFVPVLPATTEAVERYLASGLVEGIGKTYAKRIADKFGRDTFQVIDETPERLREVDGIGGKRLQSIQESWKRAKAIREVVVFLQRYGISPAWAIRLYKIYGESAPAVLRADPYRLAHEVHGIGFLSADKIAQASGIAPDDPKRIQAAVRHRLGEYAADGHVFAPYDLLEAEVAQMIGVAPEAARAAVAALYKDESIVCEKLPEGDKAVYEKALYHAEIRVAEALARLGRAGAPPGARSRSAWPQMDIEAKIAEFEQRFKFEFADRQRDALRLALRGGPLILTGGPGTGKTTTLRGIIQILTAQGLAIALAAPTGRAAKRLAETVEMPASTIHRLLKWNPQKGVFTFNESNPLQADLIVVDETSMVDIVLAHQLLKAVPPSASMLFVGDSDQLPSVGPGNFLADMIASGALPVVRLDQVFRQASRSLIVVNAHRINRGEFPIVKPSDEFKNPDFFFIKKDEPLEALETVKSLVQERIPKRFGLHPLDDIQVISPMRRGDLGVSNLNEQLQALLNPQKRVLMRGRSAFRIGDKVMQIRNNYDFDIFNGDIGRIVEIDEDKSEAIVSFDGRNVAYPFDSLDDLTLAYAITAHKSQGSEYPAVVLPIHTQHYILLQRNLFYTALTRGKRLVVVVGSLRALGIAVKNDKIASRFSGLRQRLRQAMEQEKAKI